MTKSPSSIIKFLAFAALTFVLMFDYALLRTMKDTLIVTHFGAEMIPQLKAMTQLFQLVLLVVFLLAYRAHNFRKVALFSTAALLLIAAILLATGQQGQYPAAIKGLYIVAELFGVFAIGLLFWVLANQSFTLKEAKLAYPLLGAISSLAIVANARYIARTYSTLEIADMTGLAALICGVSVVLVFLLSLLFNKKQIGAAIEPREPLGKVNVFAYLGLVFLIVFSAGFAMQASTFVFKMRIHEHFQGGAQYTMYMAEHLQHVGVWSVSLFIATFWMVYAFGWLRSALIVPVFVLLWTALTLCSMQYEGLKLWTIQIFHLNPDMYLMQMAGLQKIILAGLMPTLFITTKEMTFIALPYASGARGKALADFLPHMFRMSFAAIMLSPYVGLTMPTGKASASEIINSPLFYIGLSAVVWIVALILLSKQYARITGEK